jgi:hypothetical protein
MGKHNENKGKVKGNAFLDARVRGIVRHPYSWTPQSGSYPDHESTPKQ